MHIHTAIILTFMHIYQEYFKMLAAVMGQISQETHSMTKV
jgi:hypothetical protein